MDIKMSDKPYYKAIPFNGGWFVIDRQGGVTWYTNAEFKEYFNVENRETNNESKLKG